MGKKYSICYDRHVYFIMFITCFLSVFSVTEILTIVIRTYFIAVVILTVKKKDYSEPYNLNIN